MKFLLSILFLASALATHAGMVVNSARYGSPVIPGVFVDSVAGSDSNTGTSNSPWATSAKVESVFGAYAVTNIYFKRGGTYGPLLIPGGATITNYGTANYAPNIYGGVTNSKPVFTGAIRLTNANFTLTAGKTNTYQIDLTGLFPICTNPLATVTSSNVLMVWQNNTRLAGWTVSGSPSYAYNANTVDAGTGRFFYDVSTKILYVSATNLSSIITNGGFFEASVSTYALMARGTNNTVGGVIAEKAYAYNTSGRQGYQIYCGGGSTYTRCVGRYGWNHLIGIAASENFTPLVIDSCYALSMTTDAAGGSTAYVVYSSGNAVSAGYITNCLAAESTPDTVNDSYGYYTHDNGSVTSVIARVIGSVAFNMGKGYATVSGRSTNWSDNTSVNCKIGYAVEDSLYPVIRFTNYWSPVESGSAGVQFISSARVPVLDSKFVFTNTSRGLLASTSHAVGVTNCIFAASPTRFGYGLQGQFGTTTYNSWSNSFYNVSRGYVNGAMSTGNYNNYSTLQFIGEDMNTAPGFWSQANFANWQSAWSPVDANSTTTDPGYAAGFYTFTVTDPTGGDAN